MELAIDLPQHTGPFGAVLPLRLAPVVQECDLLQSGETIAWMWLEMYLEADLGENREYHGERKEVASCFSDGLLHTPCQESVCRQRGIYTQGGSDF